MYRFLIIILFIFYFASFSFSQSAFEYKFINKYKAVDSQMAVDYIYRVINPKFPSNTHLKTETIKLDRENIIMISLYYAEYDGATRGESKYFISFWKQHQGYIECVGSNILNIYDPQVNIANNIITVKGKRRYEPLATYYYSFIYKNNVFLYNNIFSVYIDADNETISKYHYSSDNKSIKMESIFADELIKD